MNHAHGLRASTRWTLLRRTAIRVLVLTMTLAGIAVAASAQVLTGVRGSAVVLSVGRADGVRPGMTGRVLTRETVAGRQVEVYRATFTVLRTEERIAFARIDRGDPARLKPGMAVQFAQALTPPPVRPVAELPRRAVAEVEWVSVPAGQFSMGCTSGDADCEPDERPARGLTLPRAFAATRTEITVGQYRACVAAGRCGRADLPADMQDPGYDDLPVTGVTRAAAETFCRYVGGRLPTETEWEYLARGGQRGRFPWGNVEPICEVGRANGARFADAAHCEDGRMAPVGAHEPNGFGLYDVAGNVWEWVSGDYGAAPGLPPADHGAPGVQRGGGWFSSAKALRVSNRLAVPPDEQSANAGMRCVRDPG